MINSNNFDGHSKNKGFSIVEMSVVMLIIGVLIAVALTSSSIVKKAKFQAIAAESVIYRDMIENFEQQYGYLPGDFPNAFSIWGTDCASDASDCDGDGNGLIEHSNGINDVEAFRAWQHMYLAGVSNLNLPGIAQNNGEADFNFNVPRSNVSDAGWTLDVGTFIEDDNIGGYQALRIGAFQSGANLTHGFLSAQDAFIFNNKFDNGVANTGNITFYCAESFGNIDGCYIDIIEYDRNNNNLSCFMEFKIVSGFTIPGSC